MEAKSQSNPVPSQPQNPGQTPSMSNAPVAGDDLVRRASQEEASPTQSAQTFTPGAIPPSVDQLPPSNTKPKSKKGLLIGLSVVLVLLIVAGAVGYFYYFIYVPKTVLPKYLHKLNDAKSAQFKLSITTKNNTSKTTASSAQLAGLTGKSIASNLNLVLDGSYNLNDSGNPKLDTKVSLSSASTGSETISGQVSLVDKSAYIKLDKMPQLITALGLTLTTDWYKFDTASSLSQTKCLFSKGANVGVVGSITPLDLPIKNAKRVGSETISGNATKHYRGEIDLSKFASAIENANKDLPADCKLNLTSQQFDNNAISYELWQSENFDRIKVSRTNSKTQAVQSVELSTQAYNKDIKISAPDKSQDIKSILETLLASSSSSQSAQVAQLQSAYKQQLAGIAKALENWKKTAGKYPNPGVDWLSSTAGNAAKGAFGTSAIASNFKDPVTSKTYNFTMVTSATLPACKPASSAATTATIYYQSLTKTTYTLRLCGADGTPVELKSP